MKEFDITIAYASGEHVLFKNKEYVYCPKDWRYSFSVGILPIKGKGWEPFNFNCLSSNYTSVLHYSNIKTAIQRLFNKLVSIFTGVRQNEGN